MSNVIDALFGWVLMLALVGVGIWMVFVAIRMVCLPKRNAWQRAWLILAALLTLYCGSIVVLALFVLLFGEGESQAWAGLGFVLYLFLWIGPLAVTYIIGHTIAWINRIVRRSGMPKRQATGIVIAASVALFIVSMVVLISNWDGPILFESERSADYHGTTAIVQVLIWMGADVNATNRRYGGTPLGRAALSGHRRLAELLIESGADVNAADNVGRTPLHDAARSGQSDIAAILVEAGADVNAIDDAGHTPLDIARASGHSEMARLLRE